MIFYGVFFTFKHSNNYMAYWQSQQTEDWCFTCSNGTHKGLQGNCYWIVPCPMISTTPRGSGCMYTSSAMVRRFLFTGRGAAHSASLLTARLISPSKPRISNSCVAFAVCENTAIMFNTNRHPNKTCRDCTFDSPYGGLFSRHWQCLLFFL